LIETIDGQAPHRDSDSKSRWCSSSGTAVTTRACGFAVVAREVRSLAQRSATVEIERTAFCSIFWRAAKISFSPRAIGCARMPEEEDFSQEFRVLQQEQASERRRNYASANSFIPACAHPPLHKPIPN